MKNLVKSFEKIAAILVSFLLLCFHCAAQTDSSVPSKYDQLIVNANSLLKESKLDEAKQTAQQAIQKDTNRYEGYVVAAKIASQQGQAAEAGQFAQKALKLAPDDRKAQVQQLAAMLAPASAPGQSPASAALSDEDRLTLNVLNLLLDKAGKAATPEDRDQACEDILSRSGDFLKAHPEQSHVWIMRGVAAVILNRAHEGWEAGQRLKALGMMHSEDSDVSHLFAELELKGWLGQEPKFPQPDHRWTNSLGQVFVPVPGTSVLFCIWDTRVRDYAAYAAANSGVNDTWKNGEYEGRRVCGGPDCPVSMVSWEDAEGYCRWVTEKERREGMINGERSYRLPTDAEWSLAVGLGKEGGSTPGEKKGKIEGVYPWGTEWPPPRGAGNYADMTFRSQFSDLTVIESYDDGYAMTSPVGSFQGNRYGLYDMGGNVWQRCEDRYGGDFCVSRGGSWMDGFPGLLLSSSRRESGTDIRGVDDGFRCVLAAETSLGQGDGESAINPTPVTSPSPMSTQAGNPQSMPQTRITPRSNERWTNSLGQVFMPVPGTAVLFCIWDTRVQDYAAYAAANRDVDGRWENPQLSGVAVTPSADCPVVNVNWNDANSFCDWLTKKEQGDGKLNGKQRYRLPTDWEWSLAVGLNEAREGAPREKDGEIAGIYPWGTEWPPPSGAGNYDPSLNVDSFQQTSPVGVFAPNRYGLYDMGGNVCQWCQDWYDGEQEYRVLRGASWSDDSPDMLLCSRRVYGYTPDVRRLYVGFRCVLVVDGSTR